VATQTLTPPLLGTRDVVTGVSGRVVGPQRVVLCNFSMAWEEGAWQRRFDNAAGPALARARREVAEASLRHVRQENG